MKHLYNCVHIVNLLTTLYERGEETYTSEDVAKIVVVNVERRKYTLSPEAEQTFAGIHDNWEMNVCKAYQHDILLSGKIYYCSTIYNYE